VGKDELESAYLGKIVAIEVESGEYLWGTAWWRRPRRPGRSIRVSSSTSS